MSAPVLSFLTTTGNPVTAGSVPVPVGRDNPMPTEVIGGVSTLEVESGAGADNQSNNLAFLKNDSADPDLSLAMAGFIYNPVSGLWERNRGQSAIWDSIAGAWIRDEGYSFGPPGNLNIDLNNGLPIGTTVILPAVAGTQYLIGGVNWAAGGAAAGAIQDTAGSNKYTWTATAGLNEDTQFGFPLPIPVGLGVQIVVATNPMNVSIVYTSRIP